MELKQIFTLWIILVLVMPLTACVAPKATSVPTIAAQPSVIAENIIITAPPAPTNSPVLHPFIPIPLTIRWWTHHRPLFPHSPRFH